MKTIDPTIARLCAISQQQFTSPFTHLTWPDKVDCNQWFMSPELISIYGMPQFHALSQAQQKRLSLFEAVNFFSLNINGERRMLEGIAQRLYRSDANAITPYLHHLLDDENKHMLYFARFCKRYAGKIYADKSMSVEPDAQTTQDQFLFFARIMIFEEMVDHYNLKMAGDNRLAAIVRDINCAHHLDETRHLAFGRTIVSDYFATYRCQWSAETLAEIRLYLANYLLASGKEYYNPEVYRDAGLPDPYSLRRQALAFPASCKRRQDASKRCLEYLMSHEILLKVP